jgi:hypothetical protein
MSTDPYAPPQAEVGPALSAAGEPRRPLLVWIICGFQAVGAFGGFLALMWTLSAANGRPTYLSAGLVPRPSALHILADLVAIGLLVGGAISLFRLRAVAISFVAVSLALHLGMLGRNLLTGAWSAGSSPGLGPVVLMTLLAGPIFKAGILVYAWRLRQRGVLR